MCVGERESVCKLGGRRRLEGKWGGGAGMRVSG